MKIVKFGKDANNSNVEVYLLNNGSTFRPYVLSFHFADLDKAFEQKRYWTLKDAEKAFTEATGVSD